MAPYRIVPAFYPLEDGRGNLGASCPDSGVEKFQLHRAPERLDQSCRSSRRSSPWMVRARRRPSASTTSSVRMLLSIDQPTTLREKASMTAAQLTFPSLVGCSVMSGHQFSSGTD